MKKNLLLLMVCGLAIISCKKSGDGTSNTLMLSEVYRNSLLSQKFTWSTDNLVIRYDEYSTGSAQSNLFLYATYEYDTDNKLKHRKIFAANDTLNNRDEYFYDNEGRLSRLDHYFPGQTLNHSRLYEYDQQNRINKYTQKNGGTNKAEAYNEYTYDDQGRLTMQRRFIWNSDKWKKSYQYDYITTGKNVYDHWDPFTSSPADMSRSELNMASRHALSYDLSENINNDYADSATEKQYNNSGYLIKQRVTRKFSLPVKPDESWEMQYTYVQ